MTTVKLSLIVLDVTVDVEDDTDEAPLVSLDPLVFRVGEVDRCRRGVGSSSADDFPNSLGIFEQVALSSATFFILGLYDGISHYLLVNQEEPSPKSVGSGKCL